MKNSQLFGILFFFLAFVNLTFADNVIASKSNSIEMQVNGMTCPFCVYSVEKNLNKLPHIEQAQVSLKQKKIRIRMKPGHYVDEKEVREIITKSGFTPGETIKSSNKGH